MALLYKYSPAYVSTLIFFGATYLRFHLDNTMLKRRLSYHSANHHSKIVDRYDVLNDNVVSVKRIEY